MRQTSASATHDPLLASEAGARTPGEGRGSYPHGLVRNHGWRIASERLPNVRRTHPPDSPFIPSRSIARRPGNVNAKPAFPRPLLPDGTWA